MQSQLWGIKTFYYSLINKAGSKQQEETELPLISSEVYEDEDCEACKL